MTKKNLNSACCEIREKKPDAVFYVHSGGYTLGAALADCLEVPLIPLDIRYPLSRFMERFKALAPICWLCKELFYRITRPRAIDRADFPCLPENVRHIVLADDRISSGRTLDVALQILDTAGIPQKNITVVTGRCNQKNRHRVNCVIQQ